MTEDYCLKVNDLAVHFMTREGVVRAVDGASFSVKRKQSFGIVGESGCGKSVTVRAALNMVRKPGRIVGGEVLWSGAEGSVIDVLKLHPDSKEIRSIRGKEISMIFQEPMSALSPVYTVGNQMIEAIKYYHPTMNTKAAKEKAEDLLNLVGIPNPRQRLNAYPFQLSGGMCQRVMIAIALSGDPELLIADEPTTALDVTIQAQILELLAGLQTRLGMTVILISHNLGVIASMVDRMVVMYFGKVVEEGSAEQVFVNPGHPYTRALMAAVPILGEHRKEPLMAIPGRVPDGYAKIQGCSYFARCAHAIPGTCDIEETPFVEIETGHKVRCQLHKV